MAEKKNNLKNEIVKPTTDKTRVNRLNTFLSTKQAIKVELIIIDILLLSLFNFIVNSITGIFGNAIQGKNLTQATNAGITIKNIFLNFSAIKNSSSMKVLYVLFIIAIVVLDLLLIYQIRTSLSMDNFNVNQKGEERFATVEEIKEQYREIPDKDISFPGRGGTIISRIGDKLYIDPAAVNNLVIGITRSGKDEFYVFPTIDVYSRAEEKSSMIVCDPKIESYRGSKEILEKRGYDVHLLNFMDPVNGMGYNPLQIIIQYYKQGLYDEAETLSDSFAYSIFMPNKTEGSGDGNVKFFDQTAASVFSAFVLSHVKDCLEEDEQLNEQRLKAYKLKTQAYENMVLADSTQKDILDKAFKDKQDECHKSGTDIILAAEYIPKEFEFYSVIKYEKCITVYSIMNSLVELSQQRDNETDDTVLDKFFSIRPPLDPAKMHYATALIAGEKTKGSILSNMLNGITVFQSRAIARMTAESTIDIDDIGFGEKPVAIFLGLPDFDHSRDFLANVFVRQVYFYLARKCSLSTSKCKRHVKFIINEFGTMPKFDDMPGMVTVCLGRNMSFDLYVQNYEMIEDKYGKAAYNTIKSNCGNQIYILTNSDDTAKEISGKLGNTSIVTLSRNGSKLSINKHFTESIEAKPLKDFNQLLHLREGECIVMRSMTRKNLKRQDIKAYPIFNNVEDGTRLKYRYEYLKDDFPDPQSVDLYKINKESRREIDPKERVWNYQISLDKYEKKYEKKVVRLKDYSDTYIKKVISILKEEMGDIKMRDYGITEDADIPIFKLVDVVSKYPFVDSYKKKTLLQIFRGSEEM